ncbi:MAG: response regulator receiver modulated FAD-dependent pyridine nucleotide-disulfide oxidoreductase [Acidimicrobiales bacterium]|nr:response regulator receiver modulated FAD-dependent pyridine nucleotide-disulfide oxidoreductase [Acidimicrobiales bacterium]
MRAVAPPILLTVDDDPEVSRSLARDLRQQYGEDYRIRRAESGPAALDALKELKLRDERVGLLLADHRMPEMTGVEFLEQARDLYPKARRVLLTAYADTDAAIGAINRADVDYYLLKPWDPPQEKLFPVLDDLLEDWKMQDRLTSDQRIRVVGHRWSAPSHAVKDFLTRNQVPFKWLELERDPEATRLLVANGGDRERLPLVITDGGRTMQAPSTAEVAAALGLAATPSLPFYDLIVIGGGPAGLGAAVYGASEGLSTVLVEREAIGGQAGQSARIENYLGFPSGIAGGDLARRATTQARRFGAEMLLTSEVSGLDACGSARVVRLADGSQLSAHAVLLTTGVAYRRLAAPGIDGFTGSGVYYGATATEAGSCRDEDVYIVGGANSAGQAAVFFARTARSVTIVVRGQGLERSMSHYLIDQIAALPNVRVRTHSEVVGASGSDHLERVRIADRQAGTEEEVETSWLFVFIGAAPRTDWLGKEILRDDNGFVLTGPDLIVDGQLPAGWPLERQPYFLETSVPGVFAAGDVRGQSVKRVASAVGEGAMAVTLVHRYLELL